MSSLQVMSFNVRVLVEGQPAGHPDEWRTRLPAVVEVLRHHRPDLVGTQEGTWPQLRTVLEELPDYGLVGTGREGGSNAEYSAILYRRDRFRLEGWDQWWLSATPDVIGSMGWNTSCPRIATLAEFTDRRTGKRLTLVNTPLDHVSDEARTEGAKLIAARLPAEGALVTGDFNCTAGEAEAWTVLTSAGLRDTWLTAETRGDDICTYHGYSEPGERTAEEHVSRGSLPGEHGPAVRIDWILASDDWRVSSAEILTDRPGGVWPSDHWPVVATVESSSRGQSAH